MVSGNSKLVVLLIQLGLVGKASLAYANLDLGQQVSWTYPILDFEKLPKFLGWQEEVPRVSPNFQNKLRHMTN